MEAATAQQTKAPRAPRRAKKSAAGPGTPWWLWFVVAAIVVFCLFPFYWLINISLKTGPDLASADLIPPNPTLDNYQAIFENDDFVRALLNSAIVSLITTALALVVGSFCAYALARLKFKGKFWLLALVLSITTFPAIAIAAPIFKLWSDIGLFNQEFGLGLIPPYLATAGILTFIFAWNEFLLAVTLTSSPEARTVPAAIAFFTGATQFEVPIGTISAASVVVSIPLIIMVLVFQKRIVAGLTAGAVKG